jgi:hypothetical protein
MAHDDYSLRKHTDAELYLTVSDEEALVLDAELHNGERTARVQVNVSYKDQNGAEYTASRIVKMRLKREALIKGVLQ